MTSEDSGLDLYTVRYIPGSDSKKLETLIPHKHTIGHKRIYREIGFDVGKAQQLRLASEKTLLWITGTASVLHFNIYAEHKRSANELLARKSCDLSAISSSGDPFFACINASRPVEMEVCDPVHGQLPLRTLQISEKWASIVDKAQQAVKIGLAVSEVNPIAEAAASLVKLVTDGARRRVECYDAIGETIDVIKGASEMVVEHCDGDEKQTELRDALVPLIKECGGYLCELSGSSWVKQSSSFAARKLQGMRKALQSNMDAVKQYTASAAQRDVHRLSGDVEKLTRTLQKWVGDIKNEIAGKLYSHLLCNLTIVANSLRGCLTGTREALLSEIETWAANDGARGFCLYGASGKGKSAVAHSVAIRLGTAGFDTAFFSFDKSDRSRSPLQAQLSALADDVLAANGPADQWTNLFLGPFSQQAPPRPVVLVIDALDECPDDPPEQRAALMKQLDCCLADAFPFDVRFFITARSKYGGSDVHGRPAGPVRAAEPIDGSCLADRVAAAANTSFAHAADLCQELMGTSSTSAPNILARVEQAPGQLYPLYLFLLQSRFDANHAEDMLSYRHVVTWILLVAMPQRRCVFKQFAAVHRSRINVDLVLERLESLFIGLDMDEPVQPLHASFRDFVLDAGVSGPYAISIGPDAHMDLADVCLRIMNEPGAGLRFNICQLASSYALDGIDFAFLVDKHISEGLQYACAAMASHLQLGVVSRSVNTTEVCIPREMQPHTGWMALWSASVQLLARICRGVVSLYNHHARASRLPSHVHDELEVFLKTNFLFWLEACSCMQLANLPSTALLQLSESLQDLRADDLQPLVKDYIQFNGRFQDGIAASPPQVYISGLALSPSTAAVCELYSRSFSRLISVSGKTIGEHWPDAADNVITEASMDGSEGIDTQCSQQDGWLLHPHRNPRTPFLWIPSYLRRYPFVTAPSGMVMPDYVVNIDMRDAALGEDWTKIYQPPVDESVPLDHEGQVDAPIVDDTEPIPGGFPA
ncbi:hypothetical protein EV121DRAFT_283887 [Schizophyllum commune]